MKIRKLLSRTFLVIFSITFLFIGCDKSTKPDEPFIISKYPITVGSYWIYTGFAQNYNWRPVHPGTPTQLDTSLHILYEKIEVTGERIFNDTVRTWEFRAYHIETSSTRRDTFIDYTYYRQIKDTLFAYAYKPSYGSALLPKGSVTNRIHKYIDPIIDPTERNNLKLSLSDTIKFYDIPRKVFVFPLHTGLQWISLYMSDEPWIDKTVVDKQSVRVPAGSFMTYPIRSEIIRYTSLKMYDYVGVVGIVKRTWFEKDITMTDDFNNPREYFDYKKEYVLTAYHLNSN